MYNSSLCVSVCVGGCNIVYWLCCGRKGEGRWGRGGEGEYEGRGGIEGEKEEGLKVRH